MKISSSKFLNLHNQGNPIISKNVDFDLVGGGFELMFGHKNSSV